MLKMWLPVEFDWLNSVKLDKLKKKGVDQPMLMLLRVWSIAFQDRSAPEVNLDTIEEEVRWDGDENQLIAALQATGFLDGTTLCGPWWDGGPRKYLDRLIKDRDRKTLAKTSTGKQADSDGKDSDSSGKQTPKQQTGTLPLSTDKSGNGSGSDGKDTPSEVKPRKPRAKKRREEKRREESVLRTSHAHTDPREDSFGPDDGFVADWGMTSPKQQDATKTPAPPAVIQRWCSYAAEVCKGASTPQKLMASFAKPAHKLLRVVTEAQLERACDEHISSQKGWGRSYSQAWKTLEGFALTIAAQDKIKPPKARETPLGQEFASNAMPSKPAVRIPDNHTPIEAFKAEYRKRAGYASDTDVNGLLIRFSLKYLDICNKALPQFWAFWDSEMRARKWPEPEELEMYLMTQGLPSPKQRQLQGSF